MRPEDKRVERPPSVRERAGRAVQSAGSGLTIVAVVLIVLALASGVPQLFPKAVLAIFSGSQ
jgi:hypothetical protein